MVRLRRTADPVDVREVRAEIALAIMRASIEGSRYVMPDDPVFRQIAEEEWQDLRSRGWKMPRRRG